jgi:hypothetical protein
MEGRGEGGLRQLCAKIRRRPLRRACLRTLSGATPKGLAPHARFCRWRNYCYCGKLIGPIGFGLFYNTCPTLNWGNVRAIDTFVGPSFNGKGIRPPSFPDHCFSPLRGPNGLRRLCLHPNPYRVAGYDI